MMRRYRTVIFSALLLATIAFVAHRWADLLQRSVRAYTPPPVPMTTTPGERLPGLTDRVVMVVVSGVGYRETVVQDMPVWQGLMDTGASAPVQVRPPAYWPSVWATLLSGAGNDLNQAPLLPPDTENAVALKVDNILIAAQEAGLRIAVAASADRAPLFTSIAADAVHIAHGDERVRDAQTVEAALGLIAERQYPLIIIHLGLPEVVGRQSGTASTAYRAALRQVDSYVRQIVRQMNLADSVLLLTSDGALLPDGRPAGGQSTPPTLPWVMVGQGVVTGKYSPIQLEDIAPTLAVLLGTRWPVMAEGLPLFDMLRLGGERLAHNWLLLATHKVAWGQAYLQALRRSSLPEVLQQDLSIAATSLQRGNYAGAVAAAQLVSNEVAAIATKAANTRIEAERWPRAFILAIGILAPSVFLWMRRPARFALSFIAALVTAAVLYAAYGLSGQNFSFDLLADASGYLAMPLMRDVLIGLVGGSLIVLAGFLSIPPVRWQTTMTVAYDYVLLTCYILALPVWVAYWHHGAWMTWYLPDPAMLALQTLALRHLAVLATVSLPVPWLLGLIIWFRERRRVQAIGRAQGWDPIAYLRR
ncbi:MAG: hypothetical protein NZ765_04945 [Anaerolineae bacterium]|nr:hypothetical protein [Anaerolineae bacterium]MDW8070741.1 hypothetical protein [Anaerolineae bacterium]